MRVDTEYEWEKMVVASILSSSRHQDLWWMRKELADVSSAAVFVFRK